MSALIPYPVEIQLPPHTLGDRWPITIDGQGGLGFGPIQRQTESGLVNMDVPISRFRATFRKVGSPCKAFVIDSDASKNPNAPGVIVDAATWELLIPVIQNFLPSAGEWTFEMEVYIAGVVGPQTIYVATLTV